MSLDPQPFYARLLRAAMVITTLVTLMAGQEALAGTLSVAPVRIEVAAHKQFCSLALSNGGSDAVTVQVRGFGWRRDASGNDVLDPATGPLVNPSIISIPAGHKQLVRCGLKDRAGASEESYRLIINELPVQPIAPGTVQTLMQISIPVFRMPVGAKPALIWSRARGSRGLVLSNAGNRHIQATAILLTPDHGAPVRLTRGFYLLAGGQIALPADSLTDSPISRVEVETIDGALIASPAQSDRNGG